MVAQNGSIPDETRRTRLAKTTHHLREVLVMGQWLQFLGALMSLATCAVAQCPSLSQSRSKVLSWRG
jgi:hypothetical protein